VTALIVWSIVLLVGIVGSAFFAGIETGAYSLNRVRLRVRTQQGDHRARRLSKLVERPDNLVITSLMGANVADYLGTVAVTALVVLAGSPLHAADVYATLINTPLLLVLGSIIPKDLFLRHTDRLMYTLSLPIALCQAAARYCGAIWFLRTAPRTLARLFGVSGLEADEDLLPRAHVHRLLHEGAVRGNLTSFQRDTIERILSLSHITVGRVMVPLARAATVPVDIRREDFLRVARMAHFSRILVWRDQPQNMIGVVTVFDVLTDSDARPISHHVRPAAVLRADMTVPEALLKMQQVHQFMAIVNDRRGRCVGLLTMKDLVEEVVGDLEAW
jgi:CBS domain containing-hemolysin-like protein